MNAKPNDDSSLPVPARPAPQERPLELLRRKLDYYSVVHTAQCECQKGYRHSLLACCTCETGQAFEAVVDEVSALAQQVVSLTAQLEQLRTATKMDTP